MRRGLIGKLIGKLTTVMIATFLDFFLSIPAYARAAAIPADQHQIYPIKQTLSPQQNATDEFGRDRGGVSGSYQEREIRLLIKSRFHSLEQTQFQDPRVPHECSSFQSGCWGDADLRILLAFSLSWKLPDTPPRDS
jgi:hypothetical protein